MMASKKKLAPAPVTPAVKPPTRIELLQAQASALATQLGTIHFNYTVNMRSCVSQIEAVMQEIKILQEVGK
jgi:hypothetical protein